MRERFVQELKKHSRLTGAKRHHHYNDSYTGSMHKFYAVSVPIRRKLVKDWMKEHKDAKPKEVLSVVEALIRGESHEEKTMGAILLGYHARARSEVTFRQLAAWLDELAGWAEVDAFCQSMFTTDELLSEWVEWEAFLKKLSKNKNIYKRRASLVYLTGPASRSTDKRIHEIGYKLIDVLKHEKDILITKAISWLLRSMAVRNPVRVKEYLKNNEKSLPKIAVRETKRKLFTVRKN